MKETRSVENFLRARHDRRVTRMKKSSFDPVCISLMILSVLILSTSVLYHGHLRGLESKTREEKKLLEEELQGLEETRSSLSEKLENIMLAAHKLETERENLAGDEYHLRDPLFSEAQELVMDQAFEPLENIFVLSPLGQLLYQAKKRGIRCSYVAIVVENLRSGERGQYELIGFNTLDRGMVYFEPNTGYRVFPEIGKPYTDCVEGMPYYSSPELLIKKVVTAW